MAAKRESKIEKTSSSAGVKSLESSLATEVDNRGTWLDL